jgi:predicted GIY-YIG superfamily endonuclease
MSIIIPGGADASGFASTILRHFPDGTAPREVIDRGQTLRVLAFPFNWTAEICAAHDLRSAGTYILAGDGEAYIGETGDLTSRLLAHAQDLDKAFATEVFVVSAFNKLFDKDTAQHFELRFVQDAKAAGLVRLRNQSTPPQPRRTAERLVTLNRMVNDAQRLLFDAGCRIFHSANDSAIRARRKVELPLGDFDDLEMTRVELARVPAGAQEFELQYTNVWARGYQYEDRFVVLAGSEMRAELNASTNKICVPRREKLIASGAVVKVETQEDLYRFTVSVGFRSAAVAAKIVCGAHVSAEHWKPLARPVSPPPADSAATSASTSPEALS